MSDPKHVLLSDAGVFVEKAPVAATSVMYRCSCGTWTYLVVAAEHPRDMLQDHWAHVRGLRILSDGRSEYAA